jgi:hypothetical protein
MEEVLALPRGFFTQIGKGVPYKVAVGASGLVHMGQAEGLVALVNDCLQAHDALQELVLKEGEKLKILDSAIQHALMVNPRGQRTEKAEILRMAKDLGDSDKS